MTISAVTAGTELTASKVNEIITQINTNVTDVSNIKNEIENSGLRGIELDVLTNSAIRKVMAYYPATSESILIDRVAGIGSGNGNIGGSGVLRYGAAQTFTVPDNINKLSEFKIRLKRSTNTAGSFTVQLKRGNPNGTVLFTEVVNVSTLTTTYASRTFTPGTGIDVVPGETLSITALGDGNTGDYSSWDGGASYTGGNRWFDNNTGSFSSTSGDLAFEVSGYLTQAYAILADASAAETARVLGFLLSTTSAGNTGSIIPMGKMSGFTIATTDIGKEMYLSDTPGAISSTPGTIPVRVGRALSTSEIQILI